MHMAFCGRPTRDGDNRGRPHVAHGSWRNPGHTLHSTCTSGSSVASRLTVNSVKSSKTRSCLCCPAWDVLEYSDWPNLVREDIHNANRKKSDSVMLL